MNYTIQCNLKILITYFFTCFILITQNVCGNGLIVIQQTGIKPTGYNSSCLTFYALVENNGKHPVQVHMEMEKCCQEISENDTDCKSMKLHSGLRMEIYPKRSRNVTIYFTNKYLYGRKGQCWIKIKWIQGSIRSTERFKIPFKIEYPTSVIQNLLKLINLNYGICESVDEDPFRNCLPVNCIVKYSGHRSFFNKTINKCQPTPNCFNLKTFTHKNEKKPNKILSPVSNKCKNIRKAAKFNDRMKKLEDIVEIGAYSYRNYPIKVKCINGIGVSGEERCHCKNGWTSSPFPEKYFNPELDTFIMCDQIVPQTQPLPLALKILFGFLILLMIILLLYIPYMVRRFRRKRKFERYSTELASASTSSGSLGDERPTSTKVSTRVPSRKHIAIMPPVPPIQTRSRPLELSRLAQDEQMTHPAPSKVQIGRSNKWKNTLRRSSRSKSPNSDRKHRSKSPKILKYPENFQLKPKISHSNMSLGSSLYALSTRSTSSMCPGELASSSQDEANAINANEKWSIPDTTEEHAGCIPETPRPILKQCISAEALKHTPCCSCSCCCNAKNECLKPLVTVRIHSGDINQNTYVTLRKCSRSEPAINFKNLQCSGPTEGSIEMTTLKWKQEVQEILNSKQNDWDSEATTTPSVTSSLATNLSEFWKEDESEKFNNSNLIS